NKLPQDNAGTHFKPTK
ncbi:hypothetical protein AN958_04717, partial [Leucoagaricus sp. SymC.cos]